ncbi:MAG TPA: glycoside hydrolase family 2 TIM barrel-domain containing protein [Planctomycetota bacterium]|nr:glycoside hydrolase family 2 TIM barrel-domain containing protein [Planctomycetota bacterium]
MSPTSPDTIRDLFILPDFDNSRIEATFTAPQDLKAGNWRLSPAEAGGKVLASGKIVPGERRIRFEAALKGFTPWTVDAPFLYQLVIELTVGREARRVVQSFGMRKFHVEGLELFMNNRPLYVRGVIRGREAHDHENLAGLSETEFYAKYIRNAKRLGFNFVRFHSRVPSDAWFDAADRLGILTHVEVRKYYGKYQKERELMDHDPVLVRSADWREMVLRIRNRASLMVYCLGNEINTPGRNPEVAERAAELRKLDPTRLFIDTCARGECDRGNIDFDVQHMGYFAPFGRNYDMFNTTANWGIFGSVTGKEMIVKAPEATTRREVPLSFPVVAHEVGHYVALRDLDALRKKFAAGNKAAEPWWVGELLKLRAEKGLDAEYPKLMEASIRYQYVWYKQVFESIRKSPILRGFNFLQLADTERYENANGLLDCFDDIKESVVPEQYLKFNSDAVLVADLPKRAFFEGDKVSVPVWLSNFSATLTGEGTFTWELRSKSGKAVKLGGRLEKIEIRYGLSRLATVEVRLPKTAKPEALELEVKLVPPSGAAIANSWNLWLYPNRPQQLAIRRATVALRDVNLVKRYPQIAMGGDLKRPEKLVITDRFSDEVFRHLDKGGDVLLLWRVPETRDRQAPREKYYLPSTWDRFKAVIWDRGHNLGGFLRPHPATKAFPTDGFIDFQFAGLIDDCDKASLDGFPVAVEPAVQGVDKAVRDRYDVFTFKLRELQPDWTMRRFAYLFDLRVGKGRLMVSAFNFTGLERDVPEACAMFESIAACVTSAAWKPKAKIGAEELRKWLAEKGKAPRIKERMMTQYWQLDAEPLESAQYWKDAEAWIRKK